MKEFPLKRRIGMFFFIVFIYVPLIFGGAMLSFFTLKEYLEFPSEISFSSFFIYGFSAVFILSPVVFVSFFPVFLGRRVSIKIQKWLTKYMLAAFIVTIFLQIGFKVYFSIDLELKGYITCPGTPSAWFSGMAKKYVLPPSKCEY